MSGVSDIVPVSAQYAGDSSPGPAEGLHLVGNQNRWSRVSLSYRDLEPDMWCEFGFEIVWDAAELAQDVTDFASIGVAFLAEDGSSIDFGLVPGLVRTLIDPFSTDLAGPAFFAPGTETSHTAGVRRTFFLPAPARQIIVTVRSWRNTQPFQVVRPVLRQFDGAPRDRRDQVPDPSRAGSHRPGRMRRPWTMLTQEPLWLRYALAPRRRLVVRGQVVNEGGSPEGALARVVFRDAAGAILPPPYPDTMATPAIGAFQSIPTHAKARRFTLDLEPPPGAATVELGFQAWRVGDQIGLFPSLEISLDEELTFESLGQGDNRDARGFLNRVLARLDDAPAGRAAAAPADAFGLAAGDMPASPPGLQQLYRSVRHGPRTQAQGGELRLGSFPAWTLPQTVGWDEDPFASPAWRFEYHSLAWLLDLLAAGRGDWSRQALDLAVSWSEADIWAHPDDVALRAPCLAIRTEVLLQLLTAGDTGRAAPHQRETILGELLRHGFALAELLGQNALSCSVEQIHAAGALLAAAQGLRRFPLSEHWMSVGLARLRDGFDELLQSDGAVLDPSLHGRLEVISLGMIVRAALLPRIRGMEALGRSLGGRLKDALVAAISLTDPTGRMPPLGDLPPGDHHASWIKRLVFEYGQDLVADPAVRLELSYPPGPRVIAPAGSDVIAARNYLSPHRWRYFCTRLAPDPQPQDHCDRTSFTYAADGIPWIADPAGSPLHQSRREYDYLASARAHNVAIPDGREPTAGAAWLQSRDIAAGATVLAIGSNVHGPAYAHRRIFVILQDLAAIAVFDGFSKGDRPLSFTGHLHFGPDIATSVLNARTVTGFKDRQRIRIVPHAVTGRLAGLELVHGLDARPGSMQGFVSATPGSVEPAGVLRYGFSGEGSVCGGVLMALDQAGLRALSEVVGSPEVTAVLRSEG